MKVPDAKFRGNPLSGSRADNMRTEGHDEANRRIRL
jgi:hypothetical protein